MPKASFQIAVQPHGGGREGWTSSGADDVTFRISANPGQPPRPLIQVASGGELSRITLALKTCLLARAERRGRNSSGSIPRTLVFDEIDSGVGGRVAEAVGKRLKALAESHQVLCVTHLPQIAGFADAHYFVDKKEGSGQTYASVVELSPAERVEELARMLSGEQVTTAAVEHARQMIKTAGAKVG
jgi:DNA repair protein RecN (Recombination protein N)